MKERPILFSAPMVRAILEGRKIQTRRVVEWTGADGVNLDFSGISASNIAGDRWALMSMGASCWQERGHATCRYGVPGDRLWVKETWTGTWAAVGNDMHLAYAADGSERFVGAPSDYVLPKAAAKVENWVTPLFMPRWASRITLEIVDMQVQRLQEISGYDALAEGIPEQGGNSSDGEWRLRMAFKELWDSINAKRCPWDSNPWVWALTFRRIA